ncbi:MAG: dihydroorotate dehydrogenase (quinone) [Candidatus Caldarchaeum sp.]
MLLRLVQTLLALLPPEAAHDFGIRLLRLMPYSMGLEDERLYVDTCFGRLKNPVGLAAGFDKAGQCVNHLEKLGFGYLVVGTVTKSLRKGMKKPRIVRRRSEKGLVNAMGFPNPGLKKFVQNLAESGKAGIPVLVSVSDEDVQNLIECYMEVQPFASGVEVNISSPNTPQLRHYFQPEKFKQMAEFLHQHKRRPTYLKIPSYTNSEEREMIYKVVKIWRDTGFEGVTAVNALLVDEPRVTARRGGLSGRPLYPLMLKCVKEVRCMCGEDFEIHAVGGIFTGKDVLETLMEGANTVQIYTALAYRGATAVRDMLKELLQTMQDENIHSLKELWKTVKQAHE